MALQLYLDDCAFSRRLVELLRRAGHTVVTPEDAGFNIAGDKEDDLVHFRYAVQHNLILVTKDPLDFRSIHERFSEHPGIIGICQDAVVTSGL